MLMHIFEFFGTYVLTHNFDFKWAHPEVGAVYLVFHQTAGHRLFAPRASFSHPTVGRSSVESEAALVHADVRLLPPFSEKLL